MILNTTLRLIREFNVIVAVSYNFSEYSPLAWVHLLCWWTQSVNMLAYHSLLNDAELAWVTPLKSSRLSNRCPLKSLFSHRNKAKLQGDKLGKYGRCFKIFVPSSICIVSCVSPAQWAGALSWCRIMFSTDSGLFFFLRVCMRSRLMTCEKNDKIHCKLLWI